MGAEERERGARTRVEERTFLSRGKSEIPESRMEIEESRSERELRREVTDAVRELRDCEVELLWVYAILSDVGEGSNLEGSGDHGVIGDCGGLCCVVLISAILTRFERVTCDGADSASPRSFSPFFLCCQLFETFWGRI